MHARRLLLVTSNFMWKKGPAELAGEKIDEAAEKVNDDIEEATDHARHKMEEVAMLPKMQLINSSSPKQ